MEAPKIMKTVRSAGSDRRVQLMYHETMSMGYVDHATYIRANAPELIAVVEALWDVWHSDEFVNEQISEGHKRCIEIAQDALKAWDALTNE